MENIIRRTMALGMTAAGVLAYAPFLPAQSKDPARPNIFCIVTEDISCYLGCYGDPNAKTPNLDAFSRQGIRYTNMHTPNGVSNPSRFALITGMYPSEYGGNFMSSGLYNYSVCLPDNMKAYTEFMRQAGYYCTNNAKTAYEIGVTPAQWDENSTAATWKHCPEGQPFLSIYNIGCTHESQIWCRTEPYEIQPEDIDMSVFPYFPDDPIVRKDLARMYTNIAIMDRMVKEFIDEIEAAGIADNTIIIWYSDNGGPIPRGKRSIYNTGTQIPFMVRFPDGYRAGQVEDRLCSFIDVPATILSLAGVPIPGYMEGKAFLGGQASAPRDYVYMARDRYDLVSDHSAGVRDKRFQYIRNYMPENPNYLDNEYRTSMPMMVRLLEMRDAGELNEAQMQYFKAPRETEEFYDIANDPYQLHNLAGDPAFKFDFERLKAAYLAWESGPNVRWRDWTEDDWIALFRPDGEQQVVADPIVTKLGKDTYQVTCPTPGASILYKIEDPRNKTPEEPYMALPGAGMVGFNLANGPMKMPATPDKYKTQAPRRPRTMSISMQVFDQSRGWKYYTGDVTVPKGCRLTVLACRAGFANSQEVSVKH